MSAELHMLPTKRFPMTPDETRAIAEEIIQRFVGKVVPEESTTRCLAEIAAAALVLIHREEVAGEAEFFCEEFMHLIGVLTGGGGEPGAPG